MARLAYQNNEILHYHQVLNGSAITLTNREGVKFVKKQIVPQEDGIYSDVMGSLVEDSISINEYSCSPKCADPMVGRMYEGQKCPVCGNIVTNNFGIDIERVGWINLDIYKVMMPAGYVKVRQLIGDAIIDDILAFDNNLNLYGDIIIGTVEFDKKKPFSRIGMMEFYKRYDEIISYYGKKKKKEENAEFLIKNKNRIWTSKLPVISQHLRPAFINSSERTMRYDGLNAIYSVIISNASLIARAAITDQYMNINKYLFTIQTEMFNLYGQVLQKLDGKKKLYRRKIQGTRMSWSSRMVITANTGKSYGVDKVVISYKGFLELYFFEIINCLKRGYTTQQFIDSTIYEIAEWMDIVRYSSKINGIVYDTMLWLINNNVDGLWVMVNRPPTMDIGSVQMLRVVDVIPNAIESNMKVPLTSLTPWNGDFDGDTLSTYSIKEKSLVDEFQQFNPRNLIVNKTSGYKIYNSKFGVPKDLLMFLYGFVPDEAELAAQA